MEILHSKVTPAETLSPAQYKSFMVPENNFKRRVQGLIIAEAIGHSALLIVAHNQRTTEGMVGTFTNVHIGRNENLIDEHVTPGGHAFDTAIGRIAGLGPSNKTHLWLGGVPLHNIANGYSDQAYAERRYIRERMSILGPLAQRITQEWVSDPNILTRVQLDPVAGRLYVEHTLPDNSAS